jgi:hypothetical protein
MKSVTDLAAARPKAFMWSAGVFSLIMIALVALPSLLPGAFPYLRPLKIDADRFIDGQRLSYFNPVLGRTAGRDTVVRTDHPDDWFNDDELSLRLYRNFGAVETALYAYPGFWKSPVGFDPMSGRSTFPKLAVYGASLRGPIAGGIGHGELATTTAGTTGVAWTPWSATASGGGWWVSSAKCCPSSPWGFSIT